MESNRTFWITLADGTMHLASSIEALVGLVIGEPGHEGLNAAGRYAARREWLIGYAERLQETLIVRALALGDFAWAGSTDRENTRLRHPKSEHDLFGDEPWEGRVSLIQVKLEPGFQRVPGSILLSPHSPAALLQSVRRGPVRVVKNWGDLGKPGVREGKRDTGREPARPPLFWAESALEDDLVVAPTLEGLVATIVPGYHPRLTQAQRLQARWKFCVEFAAVMQSGLLDGAIAGGEFSWAAAWDGDAALLRTAKTEPLESGLLYRGEAPLVTVRPADPEWEPPGPGPVFVLDPATPRDFLVSLQGAGLLSSVGNLASAATAVDPNL